MFKKTTTTINTATTLSTHKQRASIGLTLLLLFGVVSGATFAARLLTQDAASAPSVQAGARVLPATSAYPRLPATMEKELNDAFEPQLAWSSSGIAAGDPFVDRSGYGGTFNPTSVPPLLNGGATTTVATRTAVSGSLRPLPGSLSGIPPQQPSSQQDQAVIEAAARSQSELATKSRLDTRISDARRGRALAPLASVFSYADVFPLGVVGNGARRDALLYAFSSRQSFPASVGTKFFDAELIRISDEGVTFRDLSGHTHAVGWTRIKNKAGAPPSAANPASKQSFSTSTATPQLEPSAVKTAPSVSTNYDGLQDAVRDRYPTAQGRRRP